METSNKRSAPAPGGATQLVAYEAHLRREERSENTIAKYIRDVRAAFAFLDNRVLCKETLLAWKDALQECYAPASVNSMLAAVNSFLDWLGQSEHKVKPLKMQRNLFACPGKELTEEEYRRLVSAAMRGGNRRLALILQTICATGIRVSELRFITVEAVQVGRAVVDCKGKSRVIFLPQDLCRLLRHFGRDCNVSSGVLFQNKRGTVLDRSSIWRMMKALCARAGVAPDKVFPHNLRHLFARSFYALEKDLSRLADLLGHASISTTRIYTAESGKEHRKQLERMRLVCYQT